MSVALFCIGAWLIAGCACVVYDVVTNENTTGVFVNISILCIVFGTGIACIIRSFG